MRPLLGFLGGNGSPIIPLGTLLELENVASRNFALFIIIGQSNTKAGIGLIPSLDRRKNSRIFAIPYHPTTVLGWRPEDEVVYAAEPLQTDGSEADPTIGFGKSFAENLLAQAGVHVPDGVDILIYHHGVGGTGFHDLGEANWNPGNALSLFDQAVAVVDIIRERIPQCYPVGTLWHQGEDDVGFLDATQFQAVIDPFVPAWRTALGIPDLPFIVGGLSPDQGSYANRSTDISTIPNRIAWTAFMDPRANGQSGYPGDTATGAVGISDEATTGYPQDAVHFSAPTQRTHIGPRYVKAWLSALTHNNPGGAPGATAVPDQVADLTAEAGDTIATLSFTPPDNNGAVIERYDVQISTNGGSSFLPYGKVFGGDGRALVGLTNGVALKVQIRAVNLAGAGSWSASADVTPTAFDLEAGLLHYIVHDANALTTTDVTGNGTAEKNGSTYVTIDGVDYFVNTGNTGWIRIADGDHPVDVAFGQWIKPTSWTANRGMFNEWLSTTKTINFDHVGVVSGAQRVRVGTDPDATGPVLALDTVTDLNILHHFIVMVSATGNFRELYHNGLLVDLTTGDADRTIGDLWITGFTSPGTSGVLPAQFGSIGIWDLPASRAAFAAALFAAGPGWTP